MAALREASVRLERPAKELADSDYSLAKDLDNYCTAVAEAADIKFSKAGEVVENATNVHARRVDYLYRDSMAQNFRLTEFRAEHEAAAENSKKESRSRKFAMDFGGFEPIDFAQFVGKNNSMKTRNGVSNSVNLLSQRFPQLENLSRAEKACSIEVYDVHGEHIGEKYKFRCNQYMTASGMLVEHLAPEDFRHDCATNEDGNRGLSTDIVEATSAIAESCSSRDVGSAKISESVDGGKTGNAADSTRPKDDDLLDSSFNSYADSGLGNSIRSPDITARPESSLFCDRGVPWTSPGSRPGSSLSENSPIDGDSLTADASGNATTTNETATVNTEILDELSRCESSRVDRNVEERETSVARGERNDNESSNDDEVAVRQIRRSKRIKNSIDSVNNLNSKPWEPIPFNSVPDKIPKGQTEFKLPCPISLLKKERRRKRKKSQDKKTCPANILAESESARKKMTMYSPTSHLFHPFKEEKIEDYQRMFAEHCATRSSADGDYLAVNSESGDLLGMFKDLSTTSLPGLAGVDDFPSAATDEPGESEEDDFPMPDTPDSSGSSGALEAPTNAIDNYHNRIERSVREIYGDSDVRTAEEIAVARWHEHLAPKLEEIKRRPCFDLLLPIYKARIIRNLEAAKERRIDFNEVMQQQSLEPREVSRYCFASLQLANAYNVSIDTSDGDNNFKLTLLNKDISSSVER